MWSPSAIPNRLSQKAADKRLRHSTKTFLVILCCPNQVVPYRCEVPQSPFGLRKVGGHVDGRLVIVERGQAFDRCGSRALGLYVRAPS